MTSISLPESFSACLSLQAQPYFFEVQTICLLVAGVADVCNYSVLIGQLLAACDVCPGTAQCQVKWDTFFGSAAKRLPILTSSRVARHQNSRAATV